jgi:hypothetical protein
MGRMSGRHLGPPRSNRDSGSPHDDTRAQDVDWGNRPCSTYALRNRGEETHRSHTDDIFNFPFYTVGDPDAHVLTFRR